MQFGHERSPKHPRTCNFHHQFVVMAAHVWVMLYAMACSVRNDTVEASSAWGWTDWGACGSVAHDSGPSFGCMNEKMSGELWYYVCFDVAQSGGGFRGHTAICASIVCCGRVRIVKSGAVHHLG